jgi:hypothetical protein
MTEADKPIVVVDMNTAWFLAEEMSRAGWWLELQSTPDEEEAPAWLCSVHNNAFDAYTAYAPTAHEAIGIVWTVWKEGEQPK